MSLVMDKGAHLVIGADSFLGRALIKELQRRGHKVFGTTRRRETASGERIFLDLAAARDFDLPDNASHVYFVAADTNYARCVENSQAFQINALAIPALAERFLANGVFTLFTSSNAVFGGNMAWPGENCPPNPLMPYARHKALAEQALTAAAQRQNAASLLAIVRLTKLLDWSVPPLPQWRAAWREKKVVRPFSDFIFAPVSLDFAAAGLADIAEKNIAGISHISGSKNISYLDFARMLARRQGVPSALIEAVKSEDAGVHLQFKPAFSGLAMSDTTARAGLFPQPPEEVIEYIMAHYEKENNDVGLPPR